MDIESNIKEILRLKPIENEPFKKIKLKRLKNEVLGNLPFGVTEIKDCVLYKTTTQVPYLQIYTKENWKKSQDYFKKRRESNG